MSITFVKQYVYKNIKTGKYFALHDMEYADYYSSDDLKQMREEMRTRVARKDVSNVEEATKINEYIFYPYLLNSYEYSEVPFEQELRLQKLKKLNKNWLQKLPDKILDKYIKIIKYK